MLLGRLANMRFGLPYIIDFQDPYVTDFYKTVAPEQRPPKWRMARAVAGVVEPFSIRRAAHLVSVDAAYLRDMPERYDWVSPPTLQEFSWALSPPTLIICARTRGKTQSSVVTTACVISAMWGAAVLTCCLYCGSSSVRYGDLPRSIRS